MSFVTEAFTRWLGGRVPGSGGARRRAPLAPPLSPKGEGALLQKGSRVGPLIAYENLGEPVWSPRDYGAFAREGFMQNAIVYRSVRMVAEAAASIPLLLYEDGIEVEGHPLLELMRHPSLDHTGADFLESWYGFLLVAGNAYVEAVALDGVIRELHVLRPDRMKVLPGLDGWPEGYDYTAGGKTVRFVRDVVDGVRPILHTRLFHPANDHYGMSPIEAAATAIDIHNTASGWNKALLDNSARPSGALVYAAANGQMTEEQFQRLKSELETSFEGARNAGRPLLLEGGLDWKPLSLSPKDMDFIEAKNSAAREIALALGVPPMLLGIPGDNTYSNYAEAQRAFWRQTVLPVVNRMCLGFSRWLSPAFGGAFELKPDLDQVEALNPEREALWARLQSVSFLTDDEKRAAIGYEALSFAPNDSPAGSRPFGAESPEAPPAVGNAAKFNPYHDEAGLFTTADGAVVPGSGRRLGNGAAAPKRDHGVRVAQAGRRPVASSIVVNGQMVELTPAQAARLAVATNSAETAAARVREINPNWRAPPGIYESAEGAIAQQEAVAREAEARFIELRRDAVPNTNASWGVNRLRKELTNSGFILDRLMRSPGYKLRNPSTNEEVRIMQRPPSGPSRIEPPQKFYFGYYYRYRRGRDKQWGSPVPIPDKDQ